MIFPATTSSGKASRSSVRPESSTSALISHIMPYEGHLADTKSDQHSAAHIFRVWDGITHVRPVLPYMYAGGRRLATPNEGDVAWLTP